MEVMATPPKSYLYLRSPAPSNYWNATTFMIFFWRNLNDKIIPKIYFTSKFRCTRQRSITKIKNSVKTKFFKLHNLDPFLCSLGGVVLWREKLYTGGGHFQLKSKDRQCRSEFLKKGNDHFIHPKIKITISQLSLHQFILGA